MAERVLPLSFSSLTRWVAIALLSAVVFLLAIGLTAPSKLVVSVRGGLSNKEWVNVSVTAGTLIEVGYVHSMYGVKQREVFRVDDSGDFVLEKVLFGSAAAALYYDTDPPSGLLRQGDVWEVRGEGKRFQVLRYRISPQSGHVLKIEQRTVDLSNGPAGAEGLLLVSAGRTRGFSPLLHRFGSLF